MGGGLLASGLGAGLLLLLLCGHGVRASRYVEDTDRFPGWKGALPMPGEKPTAAGKEAALSQDAKGVTLALGDAGSVEWRGEMVEVSWKPRAFLLKNFLTDEETAHLIGKAKPTMVKSTVVDNETGKSIDSTVRTSTGTFFPRQADDVITRVEKRIAMVTHLPEDNGEGLQILHYEAGQKYEPHHDFFHDQVNARPENGGQRIATVLMYLTTPEEGGETVFPQAATRVSGPEWSECASKGLAVKTRKGDALLFYSLTPGGEVDYSSLHGSCPTTKGEKWSATKWIHVSTFGGNVEASKAKWGDCIDGDTRCAAWAAQGECTANPGFMLTSCRLSCNTCEPGNAEAHIAA